jgi:CDP-diacylglycerol--inositol 3-phosphatidyltransferase
MFRMYSSLIGGKTSHKTTSNDQFALLRLYYGNKWVLFWLCVGNEASLLGLYLLHFTKGPMVPGMPLPGLGRAGGLVEWAMLLWTPLCLIKQLMNVVQLMQAARDIAKFDVAERAKKGK